MTASGTLGRTGATAVYGVAAKSLHWITAVFVIVQITLALRAWRLPPGSVMNALLGQHMPVGLCIALLTDAPAPLATHASAPGPAARTAEGRRVEANASGLATLANAACSARLAPSFRGWHRSPEIVNGERGFA